MKPEGIRQLLGGYASGTLSEAEKKLLFEAALEDQVLFDAMADEQALKDLLDDPESRGYLQAVVDEAPRPGAGTAPDVAFGRARRADVHLGAPLAPAAAAAPPVARTEVEAATASAPEASPPRWRPKMWWGLVAAAGLAVVSVVGILRLNRNEKGTEVASNRPAPVEAAEPKRAPEPRAELPSEPKAPVADKASSSVSLTTPPPAAAGKAERARKPEPAGELRSLAKEKDAGALRSAGPVPEPPAAAPSPPPPPAVAVAQQQNTVTPASPSQGFASQDRTPGDQLRQQRASAAPQPSAPMPGQQQAVLAEQQQANTPSVQLEAAPEMTKKRVTASAGGAVASKSKAAPFAMRVRLLRKNDAGEFVAISQDTKFRAGEELVLVVEKPSGGFASIRRAGLAVPMAVETNEMARSAPVTVTGSTELVVTLSKSATSLSPGAQTTTEMADGAISVAESGGKPGQALVARIRIQLER